MRYAVKKIWNDDTTPARVEAVITSAGCKVDKRRGRGFRQGYRPYHQTLPMELAAYYTAYVHEPSDIRVMPWGARYVQGHDIQQVTFRGFRESDGKPVLRFERRDHVATPH